MDMLDILTSLFALTALEIILGIDNLIFLSIITEKLPIDQRKQARFLGLTFAWITRLALLLSASFIIKLTNPIFNYDNLSLSIRDLFLITGGFFLLYKATGEIHNQVVNASNCINKNIIHSSKLLYVVVLQIGLMDIIFSLDSVLTAIGLTNKFWIMAAAITISILVMLFASRSASEFIEKFPSLKILALCFLLLIAIFLIADGLGLYIPRGYIYFSMMFSISVEIFNLLAKNRHKTLKK